MTENQTIVFALLAGMQRETLVARANDIHVERKEKSNTLRNRCAV